MVMKNQTENSRYQTHSVKSELVIVLIKQISLLLKYLDEQFCGFPTAVVDESEIE